MDALKKLFPLSWKYAKDTSNFIIGIIIYLALGIIAGALVALSIFITEAIPVVGTVLSWLLGILSSLIELYTLAGIVILILVFAKVIKD